MATLNGSPAAVHIDGSLFTVTAPGITGNITRTMNPAAFLPNPGTVPDLLDGLLQNHGIQAVDALAVAVTPAAGVLTSQELVLRTPAPSDDLDMVLYSVDEDGTFRWHLPEAASALNAPQREFRFHITLLPDTPAEAASAVAAPAGLRRFLIRALTFRWLAGKAIDLVGKWEARFRAPGMCHVSATGFKAASFSPAEWQRFAGGRSLLFLHGTFSSTAAAFGDLHTRAPELLESLCRHYGGRVFAYDHPTMVASPADNVRDLIQTVPPGLALDLDIICHSRGGLVARTLQQLAERDALPGGRKMKIGRIIHVAVPNDGTALAEARYMVHQLDRVSTLLNVIPNPLATVVLNAVLALIKALGRELLTEMPGLSAMSPGSNTLQSLNDYRGDQAEHYAIAIDYEPGHAALRKLALMLLDGTMDYVFQGEPNDFVVPRQGVYSTRRTPGFEIGAPRVASIQRDAGIVHTTAFRSPTTHARLAEWLGVPLPLASA